tara:strand:+ start:6924 stop:8783 length:1860 start_codon:yes stop_codon:yes gene_type:complete
MCGISGLLGQGSSDIAAEIAKCLAHRGPDGCDVFSDELEKGTISLGHSRLSIIDIADSNQPIVSPRGVVLIHNGEIYNFRKIRESISNYAWSTSGDSEAIIALHSNSVETRPVAPEFARGVMNCGIMQDPRATEPGNPAEKHVQWVSKLSGIWSFAIWDPALRELILCRDPMGVKPLVRTILHDGTLLFASEVKALYGHPEFIARPDIVSLGIRLAFEYPLDRTTLFEGVTQVAQGTIETWSLDGRGRAILTGVSNYSWDAFEPMHELDFDSQSSLLLETLKSGVKDRMISDVPVGMVLSGGLDSSLIATLAKEISEETSCPLPECWTVAGSEENPDLTASRIVASSLDMEHHISILPDGIFWKKLPLFAWNGEDLDISVLFWQPLFDAMSRTVRVGLCGQGADELHGGYSRYSSLSNHSKIIESRLKLLPDFDPNSLPSGPGHPWAESEISPILTYSSLESALQFEIDRGQLSNFQLRLADRHSMAVGLEARVPFLSKSHREESYKLPADWRVSGINEKIALRSAAKLTSLPSEIISRPKMPAGTATTPSMYHALLQELEPHAIEWSEDYGDLAPILKKQPDMAIGIRLFHAIHFTEDGAERSGKDLMTVIDDVGDWA